MQGLLCSTASVCSFTLDLWSESDANGVETHRCPNTMKPPPESGFFSAKKSDFNVVCDCSDCKRAIWFSSGWATSWTLAGLLNRELKSALFVFFKCQRLKKKKLPRGQNFGPVLL